MMSEIFWCLNCYLRLSWRSELWQMWFFQCFIAFTEFIWYALQIYATIQSGSLAIAASTLDSLLDLMAGGILWITHLSMKNINIYKYPIGKLRMQPVGIIIFAAVMATLGKPLSFSKCMLNWQDSVESGSFFPDHKPIPIFLSIQASKCWFRL